MASQSQTAPAADNNQKLRRVLLIRLPSGDQASAGAEQQPQQPQQQTEQPQQPQQQQQQQQQQQNASNIPPTSQNVNSATTNDNNESHNTTEEPTGKKRRPKEGDSNMYKNYSPKQREWMLVYLSYARGQLGMPFEEKLQESVVQQTNSILAKRGRFCNINRIPSSKTLRTVWKNLWEERTVGSVIRKGGRPRIDPNLKREKRNERERQKRAAAREKREMDKNKEG